MRVINILNMKKYAVQPNLAEKIALQLKFSKNYFFFLFGLKQRELMKHLGLIIEKDPRKIKIQPEEVSGKMVEWLNHSSHWRFDFSYRNMLGYTGLRREQAEAYFSQMGTDFRLWKLNYRLEIAKKRLLEDRSLKMDELSKDLGFKDKSNFYRQFRQKVGMTPRKWRENNGYPE